MMAEEPRIVCKMFFIGCAIASNPSNGKAACILFEGFFESRGAAMGVLRAAAEKRYPTTDGWSISVNIDSSRVIPENVFCDTPDLLSLTGIDGESTLLLGDKPEVTVN